MEFHHLTWSGGGVRENKEGKGYPGVSDCEMCNLARRSCEWKTKENIMCNLKQENSEARAVIHAMELMTMQLCSSEIHHWPHKLKYLTPDLFVNFHGHGRHI